MKVVILAGGLGTRLSEETTLKPKPMVEIGGKPILWHIMKIYSSFGYNEFVVLLGYKGYVIKEYFANYFLHQSDVTIDLEKNEFDIHHTKAESWKITLVDTGLNTMTGGRIKRARDYIGSEPFLLTYGDGVGDVNISNLVISHKRQNNLCTVTSVQPSGRFGSLNINEKNVVTNFEEKPKVDGSWINGGFFVCEPEVLNYIDGDHTSWENEPLFNLAKEGKLQAFKHGGFWKPMDTLRDNKDLNELWDNDEAPWKIWHD